MIYSILVVMCSLMGQALTDINGGSWQLLSPYNNSLLNDSLSIALYQMLGATQGISQHIQIASQQILNEVKITLYAKSPLKQSYIQEYAHFSPQTKIVYQENMTSIGLDLQQKIHIFVVFHKKKILRAQRIQISQLKVQIDRQFKNHEILLDDGPFQNVKKAASQINFTLMYDRINRNLTLFNAHFHLQVIEFKQNQSLLLQQIILFFFIVPIIYFKLVRSLYQSQKDQLITTKKKYYKRQIELLNIIFIYNMLFFQQNMSIDFSFIRSNLEDSGLIYLLFFIFFFNRLSPFCCIKKCDEFILIFLVLTLFQIFAIITFYTSNMVIILTLCFMWELFKMIMDSLNYEVRHLITDLTLNALVCWLSFCSLQNIPYHSLSFGKQNKNTIIAFTIIQFMIISIKYLKQHVKWLFQPIKKLRIYLHLKLMKRQICGICQEDINPIEKIGAQDLESDNLGADARAMESKCRHNFHKECIVNSNSHKCPMDNCPWDSNFTQTSMS